MIKKKLIMITCCLVLGVNMISGCSNTESQNQNKEVEQVQTNKKDEMVADIEEDITSHDMVKVTSEEAQNKIGANYINFKNIPEGFKEYGIYMNSKSTEPTIEHVWYNPDKLELLTVTQVKQSTPQKDNEENEMIFTDTAEDGKPISDYYSWAKNKCSWGFTKNDVYVYGFMLVNDSNNEEEYKKILTSLKQ